jgi:hypothetical protein
MHIETAHFEVGEFAVQCFEQAINAKCNMLVICVPFADDYDTMPKVGVANCKQYLPIGHPNTIQVHPRLEFYNFDGNTQSVHDVEAIPIFTDGTDDPFELKAQGGFHARQLYELKKGHDYGN